MSPRPQLVLRRLTCVGRSRRDRLAGCLILRESRLLSRLNSPTHLKYSAFFATPDLLDFESQPREIDDAGRRR